jgi:hypothetical protein
MYVICYFFADKLLVNARAMLLLQKNYIVFLHPIDGAFTIRKKIYSNLTIKEYVFLLLKQFK